MLPLQTNDISVEPTNKVDKKKQGKGKESRGNISCKIHRSWTWFIPQTLVGRLKYRDTKEDDVLINVKERLRNVYLLEFTVYPQDGISLHAFQI